MNIHETLGERLARIGWNVTESGCWEWAGLRNRDGYGKVYHGGKYHLAHRVARSVFTEPVPNGAVIIHSCDNPPCINPAHLRSGTVAENNADAVEKGRNRGAKGTAHRNAKLTDEDVRNMREDYAKGMRQADLVKKYGVNQSGVSKIVTRRTWKHI